MNKSILYISLLLLLSTSSISCLKKDIFEKREKAIIFFKGNEGVDACGYMMQVESFGEDLVKPVNLPDEYKVDNKKVRIRFVTTTGTAYIWKCGISYIEITSIKEGW